VCARYGWTEDYIFHDHRDHVGPYLPYARWVEICEVVVADHERQRLDRWQRSAFVGWQLVSTRRRYENEPDPPSFGEWLEIMGLEDPEADPGVSDEEIWDRSRALMAQFGVEL
jgi:hypothetical protein